jgi:hypothetical protein
VLACDVFYREDISDAVTGAANQQLRAVVGDLDAQNWARVIWVEARHLITKDMLVDHVHLNEEGYRVWDAVLFPYVAKYRKVKYRKTRRWKARRWKARHSKAKILRSSSQQTVEKEKRKVIAKTNDKGYEQEWPALGS